MLVAFIEIFIITIILNYLMSFFWNTKSMDVVGGFFAFLFIFAISNWFNLPVIHKIMLLIVNVAVLAIIIIFQPELRSVLSKLSLKNRRLKKTTQFDKFLDHLTNSVYKLAEKKVGSIIALENEDSLNEYAQKAVILNADFSSELLESIFTPRTPLHDGAIIIRDQTIIAAAVILPLMEDSIRLNKSMGTRHRAGIGLSNISDALVIVISEETGDVSIARDGIMTRVVKIDRFKGIIKSIFNAPGKLALKNKFNLREWINQ